MITTVLGALGAVLAWLFWEIVGDAVAEGAAYLLRSPHQALVRRLARSRPRVLIIPVLAGLTALTLGVLEFLRVTNADDVSAAMVSHARWGLGVAAVAVGLLLWLSEAWRASRVAARAAASEAVVAEPKR
jgi:hypothetical protein